MFPHLAQPNFVQKRKKCKRVKGTVQRDLKDILNNLAKPLTAAGNIFLGIYSSLESIPPIWKFLSGTLSKRETADVLDKKSIPVSKIKVFS